MNFNLTTTGFFSQVTSGKETELTIDTDTQGQIAAGATELNLRLANTAGERRNEGLNLRPKGDQVVSIRRVTPDDAAVLIVGKKGRILGIGNSDFTAQLQIARSGEQSDTIVLQSSDDRIGVNGQIILKNDGQSSAAVSIGKGIQGSIAVHFRK